MEKEKLIFISPSKRFQVSAPKFEVLPILYFVISDSNEIRTHNELVRKRTLNHLAKLDSL